MLVAYIDAPTAGVSRVYQRPFPEHVPLIIMILLNVLAIVSPILTKKPGGLVIGYLGLLVWFFMGLCLVGVAY